MSAIATPTEVTPVLTNDERLAAAQSIVKKNMYISMGVGCVPIPLVDLVGIGGTQVLMIKQLSDLYGVKFSEHVARNLVSALVGTLSARVITAGVVGSLFKTIPGFGAILGGLVTGPVVAGSITYAIGKVFVKHFEDGGTLLNMDVQRVRSFFAQQYQVGQKVAAQPAPAAV